MLKEEIGKINLKKQQKNPELTKVKKTKKTPNKQTRVNPLNGLLKKIIQ